MDEYLDEEVETAKQSFETICKEWERQVNIISIPDCQWGLIDALLL